MRIRDLVGMVVDADVECGAVTQVFAQREDGLLYSIKDVIIEPGEEFEGNRDSGPVIIIKLEEM